MYPEKSATATFYIWRYFELVCPQGFTNDNIEVIVIEEFNRSHKKAQNAVMQLTQFESINGHRFHDLRVLWAIVNSADDQQIQYGVQLLNPAQ